MSVTMNATMNYARDVYFGPGIETFLKVGSVSQNERVKVHWKENGYYNITYLVTSTGKYKSGYVPAWTVSCDGYVEDKTVKITENMRTTRTCNSLVYAFYRAVGDSAECVGSISAGDNMWLVWTAGENSISGNPFWQYVQYPVDGTGKYKRGWIFYT